MERDLRNLQSEVGQTRKESTGMRKRCGTLELSGRNFIKTVNKNNMLFKKDMGMMSSNQKSRKSPPLSSLSFFFPSLTSAPVDSTMTVCHCKSLRWNSLEFATAHA